MTALCKQGLFWAIEILLARDSRKEDNPRHWEWGRCFSTVSALAGPEKAGWCSLLCLDGRVESDLFHYMQLISFQLFMNRICWALPMLHSLSHFWHLPCTPNTPLCMEAGWRHSTVVGWEAWGSCLSPFPTPVVSELTTWSWCSFLRQWYVILDGAHYCCTGPGALHGQVKWAGVQWLLGVEPDSWLVVVSRCWDAGWAVSWCEPSLSPSAWGFLLSLCLLPLETAWLHLMGVQRNQPLSMNLSHYKFESPWRSNYRAIAFPHRWMRWVVVVQCQCTVATTESGCWWCSLSSTPIMLHRPSSSSTQPRSLPPWKQSCWRCVWSIHCLYKYINAGHLMSRLLTQ